MPTNDLGVDLIRAERERQITDEGYTPDHDQQHGADELVDAAVAYAYVIPGLWPWHPDTYKAEAKQHDDATVRDLVKAGALIAAAIDRHLAAEENDPTPCCPDPGCTGQPCTFPGYADNH